MRLLSVFYLFSIFFIGTLEAETLSIKEKDWISTAEGNSLEKAPGVFSFKKVISTNSEAINIHSHYKDNELKSLKNYTYSGQMRLESSDGGIGITFHSRDPKADQYYRLRTTPGSDFHIAPHPDGTQVITSGETSTGVVPTAGAWYNFKINVRTTSKGTRIKAKVWQVGSRQPGWQVDCVDESDIRIKSGRLGIWSMATGVKAWRNLAVN